MIKKIFIVFVCVCLLSCCLIVPVSAASSYTEYTQFSGFAFSDSMREIVSGYAYNYINSNFLGNGIYNYWVAVRVDEYKYLLLLFEDLEDLQFTSSGVSLVDGEAVLFDDHAHSYTDNYRTYYQLGTSYVFNFPVNISVRYINTIGNISSSVNPTFTDKSYFDNSILSLQNIVYTLLVFLFLFVAFKFMNKRWLLP